jgi:lipoate-protein ligase A
MLCINLKSTEPSFNLAAEEYFLKNSNEEYLLLYINKPSVIIGKHQVAHRESDTKYVTTNNIPVIRRITGGGSVYHDYGNLNFSFILNSTAGNQVNFRKYTRPVTEFLSSLGLDAKFEDKNDLRTGGYKISGNAEHIYRERVLHHGTLLYSSDLDALHASLRKDISHYTTKAVRSNPSPVTCFRNIIGLDDINEFRDLMFRYFLGSDADRMTELTQEDIVKIEMIEDKKYSTWEWNYGYGPDYIFENRTDISGRQVFFRFRVSDGIITDPEFDESDRYRLTILKKIRGCRHMPQALKDFFREERIIIQDSDIFKFF